MLNIIMFYINKLSLKLLKGIMIHIIVISGENVYQFQSLHMQQIAPTSVKISGGVFRSLHTADC